MSELDFPEESGINRTAYKVAPYILIGLQLLSSFFGIRPQLGFETILLTVFLLWFSLISISDRLVVGHRNVRNFFLLLYGAAFCFFTVLVGMFFSAMLAAFIDTFFYASSKGELDAPLTATLLVGIAFILLFRMKMGKTDAGKEHEPDQARTSTDMSQSQKPL